MATQETQILDNIIASRRALLVGGGAALAALAMPTAARAVTTVASFNDNDILNFALNLEYLEANFYYLAAFGTNITVANGPAAAQSITGSGTQGTVLAKASPKVPFTNLTVASYALETAIEEGKHVSFLRSALGSAAVAQPQIDLTGGATYSSTAAFNAFATAAGIPSPFDPFLNDANFLLAAYIFEDVGVTAYLGASPLFTITPAGKGLLAAATSLLAVEGYHAGLVRSTINAIDVGGVLTGYTQKISALRAAAAKIFPQPSPDKSQLNFDVNPDDNGIGPISSTYSPAVAAVAANPTGTPPTPAYPAIPAVSRTHSQLVDGDLTNETAFERTTNQVLNIVTLKGNPVAPSTSGAAGGFFPNGLNGTFV